MLINELMGATKGMDIVNDTNTHSSGNSIRGWKYIIILDDAVIDSVVDNGPSPSTNLLGTTFKAGALLSANGFFTSITLTSGVVSLIRG